MKLRRAAAGLGLALAITGLAACASTRREPPRLNLLLVTVDCLRPDHLGSGGAPAGVTPNLDRFAAESVVFSEARAVSAWTLPGVVSLLTGVYPSTHRMDARGREPAEVPHLPGLLRNAGYRVPALTALTRQPGMERFQVEPVASKGPEERPGDQLLEFLASPEAAAGPFFAWYHWRSLHLPYDPGPGYEELLAAVPDSPGVRQVRTYIVIPGALQSFLPEEHAAIASLYQAEVRRFDDGFGALLARLESRGLLERTVLVVTADHGEELFEHGLVGHASTTEHATLFDEILRIPLLIRIPGTAARRVDCPVGQVDLLPTVLTILGLGSPAGLEGCDLTPLLTGGSCPSRPLFAETIGGGYQAHGESARRFLRAVVADGSKLIESRSWDGAVERRLFDLARDPGEHHDLAVARPERARHLATTLDGFVAAHGGPDAWRRPLVEPPERVLHNRRHLQEVPTPRILAPEDGDVLAFTAARGTVAARWSGSPTARYVVEYDVGEGPLRVGGTFQVTGTEVAYGPFSAEMWAGLVQFNPWRLRVWPVLAPQHASGWVTVRLSGE